MAKGDKLITVGIKVEGLKGLQRQLSQAADKDMQKRIRKANKDAASIVSDEAKNIVPVRTGALRKSIGARGTNKAATVKAGTAARVPYAGPVHFGWRARGIEPQPFLYEALGDKWREVYTQYDEQLSELVNELNRKK